ncbi:MAG: glycosyltransferase family 4 protein [candidate division WOR-3 bacterium]
MVLFILGKKGGGVGKFLSEIEGENFEIWEVEKGGFPEISGYEAVVINGYFKNLNPESISVPKFFFFHGLRALSRRMVFGGFEKNPLNLYKLLKFKKWVKKFDGWLAPSFSMAEMCNKFYGINPYVVHIGLDFNKLPNPKGLNRERALLWVGRNAWIKGVDRFLKLVDITGYEGWVIGLEGKDKKNVKFFGYVEDLSQFYERAYALIVSSYYESFSLTALEALYYNTPVITFKTSGGVWEILQMLGLYDYGFDSLEEMAEYIKGGIKPPNANLEYFSIQNAKNRLKKALGVLMRGAQ